MKKFFSISVLTGMAGLMLAVFSMTSCSSDSDDDFKVSNSDIMLYAGDSVRLSGSGEIKSIESANKFIAYGSKASMWARPTSP